MTRPQPRRFSLPTAILWAAGLAVLTGMVGPMSSSGTDTPNDDREERCRREVVELHEFLEGWSNGTIESTDEGFARFADVIDEDFVIISPGGEMTSRGPLVEALRGGAHGRWKTEGGAPGRIQIKNFRVHRMTEDMVVATYEEWHEVGGKTRARMSTVVFGERRGAPNGVAWLHLHEVWMS